MYLSGEPGRGVILHPIDRQVVDHLSRRTPKTLVDHLPVRYPQNTLTLILL